MMKQMRSLVFSLSLSNRRALRATKAYNEGANDAKIKIAGSFAFASTN